MQKFGSLTLGIRNYNIFQILYPVVFLLRRVAFVVILIYFKDQPAIAINFVLLLNIAAVTYLCTVEPHDNIFSHRLEMINEALLQIITYHLAFSMLSTGVAFDDILGWCMIGFVALLLVINLSLVSMTTIKTMYWKYQLKKLKNQRINEQVQAF